MCCEHNQSHLDVKISLHVEECVNEGQEFSLHAQLLLEEIGTVGGATGG